MEIDWEKYRGVSGDIFLPRVYTAISTAEGLDERTEAVCFLIDLVSMQSIKSRQVAALALMTARAVWPQRKVD